MRNSKSPPTWRDRLFTVGCIGFGAIGIMGIGLGVLTCVETLHPGLPVVAAQPTTEISRSTDNVPLDNLPVDLNDPNVRIHYDENGKMVIDVYLTSDKVTDVELNTHGTDDDPIVSDNQADETKPDEQVTEVPDEQTTEQPDEQTVEQPDEQTTEQSDTQTTDDTEVKPDEPSNPDNTELKPSSDSTTSDGDIVYTIQPGDTLTKISGMTGYSVDFLAEYNHIEDKNLIYAYASLRYPAPNQEMIYSSTGH